MLVNDVVRVVQVTLPPGESTLFHEHRADMATVVIAPADLSSQPYMGEPRRLREELGQIGYTAYASMPFIHRVSNIGQTTFEIVAAEIRASPSSESLDGGREPPYELALENERVRIWRLMLEPNQANDLGSLELATLRVAQTGGRLMENVGNGAPELRELGSGSLQWLPKGESVAIRNVGDSQVVIVDIEIR
jgi:hypothetical protein